MIPPTLRNRTPHSAVTAGGPNDRDVTRSNPSTRSSRRAIVSTRPMTTSPCDGAPSQSRTSMRKFALFAMESVRNVRHRQRSMRTRAGSPPPLPRSANANGGLGFTSSQHSANPRACSICGSIALGPKKPRALDSSRARGSQNLFTGQSCRSHYHKAARVITFRTSYHRRAVAQSIMDCLAVGGRHRFKGTLLAGGRHFFCHLLGKAT